MTETEARLARRLAIAFWKGEWAERIEVALFDAAPPPPSARLRQDPYHPINAGIVTVPLL